MDKEVMNSEYEVIRRRIVLARKLKDLAETSKDNVRLSELISNADIELTVAEDACRFGRFNVAADCLARVEKALAGLNTATIETAPAKLVNSHTNANSYLVIDLSKGTCTNDYPVSYMATPPYGGFNTDEYKTSKIALRRIIPGTFNLLGKYKTVITKSFYIGLFEITQRQWELVMGQNPARHRGAMRPVERVFFDTIRGDILGAGWPKSTAVDPGSFIGRLRTRTHLKGLDLPTEAQWEYAFLASATSDNCDQDTYRRFFENSNNSPIVGSNQPNDWGLYYSIFNYMGYQEWCLDWFSNDDDLHTYPIPFIDPKGPLQEADMNKVMRSHCMLDPSTFSSDLIASRTPEVWFSRADYKNTHFDQSHMFSFRLAMHLD